MLLTVDAGEKRKRERLLQLQDALRKAAEAIEQARQILRHADFLTP